VSRLRHQACQVLADYITARIPSLAARAVHAEPEDDATYPSAVVMPRRFSFVAFQSDEVNAPEDSLELVTEVGAFEGSVDLRLYALSAPQREEYEDKLVALFLERDGAPGVLVVTCPAVTIAGSVSPPLEVSTYDAPVAFTLDESEWNDEKVFDKRRYTYLTLGLVLPALLLQHVATIEEYVLAITNDLASDVPDEEVQITEDGELAAPSEGA
jgi:hypothetical protein